MNNFFVIIFIVLVNKSIRNDGIKGDNQDDFHLHSYGISNIIHFYYYHFKPV